MPEVNLPSQLLLGYPTVAIKFTVAINFWTSGDTRPSAVMPIRGVCVMESV